MNDIERYAPDIKNGLNDEQINIRRNQNQMNIDNTVKKRSIGDIIAGNLCTLFNLINAVLAAALIYVHSIKNAAFLGVVVSNLLIGIIQEIRAKITVDKLTIMSASKVRAIRNGKSEMISIEEIVLDDVLYLESGNQVPADCIVLDGECSSNESLITGESDEISKKIGDTLMSGSFIASGSCYVRADKVGKNSYSAQITSGAKKYVRSYSEIMESVKKIIKIISLVIFPVGALLFYNQYTLEPGTSVQEAVVHTVAVLIGMIPEGLMLLTSTVFAVGVIRLSKHKVLVREMYCIESLARVDTLCLDKTGTLTEGYLTVSGIEMLNEKYDINSIMSLFIANIQDSNSTFMGLQRYFSEFTVSKKDICIKSVPFSGKRKWSGISLKSTGSIIVGAPEFVMPEMDCRLKSTVNTFAQKHRVLFVCHSKCEINDNQLPEKLVPIALILLDDVMRSTAPKTIEYFKAQNVNVKVISGDNPQTVASIAKEAGIKGEAIDMSKLGGSDDIKSVAEKYTIFGRVTPIQKKELILALKAQGHTVAMTGDGVNDVLALKEADCSIAMNSGSDASRNISHLVLLNSDFDSLPKVVAEGRRLINNIQRSSSLFLVKTIYSTVFAVLFIFINIAYPFVPVQLSLISALWIGVPSFVLALEPNTERVKGNFFRNVLKKSFPGAITIILNIALLLIASQLWNLPEAAVSTIAVCVTGFTAMEILYKISKPLNIIRKLLLTIMALTFVLAAVLFGNFFMLTSLEMIQVIILVLICAASAVFINLSERLINKR